MRTLDIAEMLKSKNHITIDIVGDSITEGTQHCTAEETYVAQYTKMLAQKYPDVSVYRYDGIAAENPLKPMERFDGPIEVNVGRGEKRIDIIRNGIGGSSVRIAINRMHDYTGELANGRRADITVFMFGINDALKTAPERYVSSEVFGENYRELLREFRKTEDCEIVIMSATTNDQCIDEHVKETKIVADENGILYIDQNAVWNDHYDVNAPHFGHGEWLSEVSYDACHPTPKGAYAIAKTLFEQVN